MAIQISTLIQRAQMILQDVTGVRWDETELLWWFNDARRELAVAKPAEFAQRVTIPLVAGTYQAVPAEAFALLRVNCNLKSISPRLPGRAVTVVERRVLEAVHPRWEDSEVFEYTREATHFLYEEDEASSFYVFPGNDGTGTVEATICVLPAEATDSAQSLGVRDLYASAMLDYMLYRALTKDDDAAANAEKAKGHYAAFATAVGIRGQVEAQTDTMRSN